MPRIHINEFAGLHPITDGRIIGRNTAQVAHNCLLTDGSLRPLPLWTKIRPSGASVARGLKSTAYVVSDNQQVVQLSGPSTGNVAISINEDGQWMYGNRSVPSALLQVSHTVQPMGLSKKPVTRFYAVSPVFTIAGIDYEGALVLSDGNNADALVYEGDACAVGIYQFDSDKARLYRNTSDVTTGGGTNAAVTGHWQLVAEFVRPASGGSVNYVDSGAAVSDPFDTYLYRGPLGIDGVEYQGFLAIGAMWAIWADGTIALSEKDGWLYWPVEQRYSLGAGSETITAAASSGNTIYVGTEHGLYVCRLGSSGDGKLILDISKVQGTVKCMKDSLVATSSGALYTSPQGVMAVGGGEARLLTAGMARGKIGPLDDGSVLRFDQIEQAFYHQGNYYGFVGLPDTLYPGPVEEVSGFRLDTGNALSPQPNPGRLVTLKGFCSSFGQYGNESGQPAHPSYVTTERGLVCVFRGVSGVYTLPLPEDVTIEQYNAYPKTKYTWRSKKFVFPGQATMAAAKVVHDCSGGGVRMRVYVDCCCVFQTVVRGCVPFRLPDQLRGIEWEVELSGCSRVTEIKMASSMAELMG